MSYQPADNPVQALLAGTEEDQFTEFLARLLRERDLATEFLRRVCGFDRAVGRPKVQTRRPVPDGCPDLVITGSSYRVIIEVKLASPLHEGQLVPYAAELGIFAQSTPGADTRLLVLAPSAYRPHVKREAEVQVPGSLSKVISWEEVATFCREESAARPGTREGWYLVDFAELIEARLGPMSRPLTRDEADLLGHPLTGRTIHAAVQLLEMLTEKLKEEAGVQITFGSAVGYQGQHLTYNGKKWWFGFWPSAWRSAGGSPLILQLLGVDPGTEPPELKGLQPPVRYSVETFPQRGWAVPLVVRPGVEPADIAAEHAQIIMAWLKGAPETGTPC